MEEKEITRLKEKCNDLIEKALLLEKENEEMEVEIQKLQEKKRYLREKEQPERVMEREKESGTDKVIVPEEESCLDSEPEQNIEPGEEVKKTVDKVNVPEVSKAGALAYRGMNFGPVTREFRDGERLQGSGIFVTRLCAQDAKLLKNSGIGEDDVLAAVLNGDFDFNATEGAMKYMEFDQEEEWIQGYKDKLRAFFRQAGLMTFQAFENGDVSRVDFEAVIYKELAKYKLPRDKAAPVCESFMRDILSYGRLDNLINSQDISDIRLMDRNTVNVQYHGVWYRTNVKFATEEEYVYFINRMCTINHSAVNIREADTVFTDIQTFAGYILRITVTHSLLSTAATYSAHIRISPRKKKTAEELITERFWTREQAAFITTAVRKKKSIIICGSSGSGKTVLLNLLLECMDPSLCGTCIQESDELHSETHPNIEFLHSVTAKGEGGVEYTLKRIATKALLKNAEAFIIGEIKGDEATDFFTASRTSKVYATTHSDDCFGALPRLSELAKYNADYSQADILRILSKNIDYVIYCEQYKVKQIAGVVGYDRDRDDVVYDLYDFVTEGEEEVSE